MHIKQKLHVLLVCLFVLPFTAYADSTHNHNSDRVKPKGNYNEETKCVKDIADMRRNHMEYIIDQRNATSRQGIRTEQFSLQQCIDCHNPAAEDGKVAHHTESKHFCSSCHTYVGVKIDCFSCHTSKPQNTEYRMQLNSSKNDKASTDEQLTLQTLDQMSVKEERQ